MVPLFYQVCDKGLCSTPPCLVQHFTLFPGAVLTAFIGVNGLVRRLALDRSLPAFLLETNSLRGTNHWIAFVFFGLCTSLFLILKGEVGSLANVYSLSFLLVMALFAFGCMMLKFKRSDLKRDVKATWTQVLSCLFLAAFLGHPHSGWDRLCRRHSRSHWQHLFRSRASGRFSLVQFLFYIMLSAGTLILLL